MHTMNMYFHHISQYAMYTYVAHVLHIIYVNWLAEAMQHFPLLLDVKNRDVLVVGGGSCAARKAAVLANAGARVAVLADRPGVRAE